MLLRLLVCCLVVSAPVAVWAGAPPGTADDPDWLHSQANAHWNRAVEAKQKADLPLSRKRFRQAAELWKKASVLAPQQFRFLFNAARAYREAGTEDEAREGFRAFLKRYPDAPAELRTKATHELERLLVKGAMELGETRPVEAPAMWLEAYQLAAKPVYLVQAAEAFGKAGEAELAKATAARLLSKHPNLSLEVNKRALTVQARAAGSLGAHTEAAQKWAEAYLLVPEAEFLLSGARALVQAGRCEQARQRLGLLASKHPGDAQRERDSVNSLRALCSKPDLPPGTQPSQEAGESLETWGWVSVGLGAALVVIGMGLQVAVSEARDPLEDAVAAVPTGQSMSVAGETKPLVTGISRRDALRDEASAQELDAGSAIALALGGALVVTGIVMLVLDEPGPSVNASLGPGRATLGLSVSY